jgi:hypothetical protein
MLNACRRISTVVSTQIFKGAPLPLFTWGGVVLVFGGSVTYMIASQQGGAVKAPAQARRAKSRSVSPTRSRSTREGGKRE